MHAILQICTRRTPYAGLPTPAVMFQVFSNVQPPEPTVEECSGVPISAGLWRMITACWTEEPSKRPHIADVLTGLSSPTAPSVSPNSTSPAPPLNAKVMDNVLSRIAASAQLDDKASRSSCCSSPTDTIVGPAQGASSASKGSKTSPVPNPVSTSADPSHGEVLDDWMIWDTALLTSPSTHSERLQQREFF